MTHTIAFSQKERKGLRSLQRNLETGQRNDPPAKNSLILDLDWSIRNSFFFRSEILIGAHTFSQTQASCTLVQRHMHTCKAETKDVRAEIIGLSVYS